MSGAKNMAEALSQNQYQMMMNQNQIAQPQKMSIAMRMKQNRDALIGNTSHDMPQPTNPFSAGFGSHQQKPQSKNDRASKIHLSSPVKS